MSEDEEQGVFGQFQQGYIKNVGYDLIPEGGNVGAWPKTVGQGRPWLVAEGAVGIALILFG